MAGNLWVNLGARAVCLLIVRTSARSLRVFSVRSYGIHPMDYPVVTALAFGLPRREPAWLYHRHLVLVSESHPGAVLA